VSETGAPFSPRALRWIVGVSAASFLVAFLWGIFGPELVPESSFRTDTLSPSAIGHAAFVEMLEELDVPVVVSRHNSGAKAGRSSLLMVIEPHVLRDERELHSLRGMIRRARKVLVVLPRRRAVWEDPERPGWAAEVEELPLDRVQEVLDVLELRGNVVRARADLRAPEFGALPSLERPQLVRSPDIVPIVSSDEGILFGNARFGGKQLYVLADPDVLANHGLSRPGNAAFAMRLVDWTRGRGRPGEEQPAVVIDETTHGYLREPSLYRELFRYPLVLATAQALLAVAVLVWASFARFGRPPPPRPALGAGRTFLIDNVAGLLRFGGHAPHALRRYLRTAVRRIKEQLHVPASLGKRAEAERLDARAGTLGLRDTYSTLAGEIRDLKNRPIDGAHALVLGRRIHRWKEEMIHGRRRDS